MLRTARGTIKMSIFDNTGSKVNDELLKIEHEKLKLKAQELEMKMVELNMTNEMKMAELNMTNEMKMVELSYRKEMKMIELNNTKEIQMIQLNNDKVKNAISVFAIIAFLIFSVQLRDGLLGKITTLTSFLQSFYDLGIGIKTLMGKISGKLYLSVAIIFTIVVIILSRTDHLLKGVCGIWHLICSKALLIIRRNNF
jgi:hypothetical protein